jgi:hypothetical protein
MGRSSSGSHRKEPHCPWPKFPLVENNGETGKYLTLEFFKGQILPNDTVVEREQNLSPGNANRCGSR